MEEQNTSNPNPTTTPHLPNLEKTLKEVIHLEHKQGKEVNWKSFKHGLQIHHAQTAWATAVSQSANTRPRSSLSRTTSARFAEKDHAVAALLQQRPQAQDPPPKMSLKSLLADAAEGYSEDEEIVNKEEEEEEEEEEGEGEGDLVCCMCVVRHKGKAFVACGHSFCRLCSKEFWVSRGNCPVCNSFVLEILHIF